MFIWTTNIRKELNRHFIIFGFTVFRSAAAAMKNDRDARHQLRKQEKWKSFAWDIKLFRDEISERLAKLLLIAFFGNVIKNRFANKLKAFASLIHSLSINRNFPWRLNRLLDQKFKHKALESFNLVYDLIAPRWILKKAPQRAFLFWFVIKLLKIFFTNEIFLFLSLSLFLAIQFKPVQSVAQYTCLCTEVNRNSS